MPFRRISSSILLFLSLAITVFAAESTDFSKARIKDPSASFLDVKSRRAELASATNPRVVDAIQHGSGCITAERPAPPPGRMIIPHHYLNGSSGPINPEEAKVTAVYQKFEDAVSDGASRYVVTGKSAEATCVADLLERWASANALLDYSYKESSQAWYQVEWTLSSIALSYSVVQDDPSISMAQRKTILKWMHDVTEHMFEQDPHPEDHARENNHAYWRALCATAVGILTTDQKMYRRGIEQYARAIGELNPDGSFPLEMARHENALHYQSFALTPLVMIAELARRQGLDLYQLRVNGHSIDQAVDFLVRASADPSLVKKYAPEPQTFSLFSRKKPPAWTEFWARRHPGKAWNELVTKRLTDATIGGSSTIYAAPTKGM